MGKFKKPVVALGVFDGVHRAHRLILRNAVACARRIKGRSIVVTFWPHPQKEESLYSLEHRLRLLGELGIDVCVVINFNKKFAKIPAVDFVKNILFKKIQAYYIYVGKNFRFGKDAEGDFKTLERLSKVYNFKLKGFEVSKINNKPISSTYIRALIKKGDLITAKKLLLRPVSVLGTVIRGGAWGRKLGFPTANINPHHEVLAPSGVYAVKILFNNRKFRGICYIGRKPTFQNLKQRYRYPKEKHIEVYIFNFKRNIYGEYLETQFIKKIREEKKFPSLHSLAKQVKKDIRIAQALFSRH